MIIANLSLQAPTRKYQIDVILRQKPSLEAPAEACLKALLVADRLSESILILYLGLAVEEFGVIIAELINGYFVRRSGPDLILTQKGKEAIDPNAEGQRRRPERTMLVFEETAFAEVQRSRSKSWMLRMSPMEIREDGRPEAAEAFREGFISWRARSFSGKDTDVLSRVVNVTPMGRDFTVIKVPVALAPASNAAYLEVSRIELGTITSASRREACAQRFRETVLSARAPRDGASALEWIGREIMPIPGAPAHDPVAWARRAKTGEFARPIEAVWITESAPSIISRGGLGVEGDLAIAIDEATSTNWSNVVLWSPPEGEAWRLDADIESASQQLAREMTVTREDEPLGLIVGLFRLRRGREKDLKATWPIERNGEPFDSALLSTSPSLASNPLSSGIGEVLPQSLELVVRPGGWVLAIAHLWTERSPIPIPVGIFTTDCSAVKRVTNVFQDRIRRSTEKEWLVRGGPSGYSEMERSLVRELDTRDA